MDIALSLITHGRVLRDLDRLDEAEPLFRDALVICRRAGADARVALAWSLSNVAMLLLEQARREVFEAQLEVQALRSTLADCARRTLELRNPASLTPLSFPLWAEAMRGSLSTEDWGTRMRRAAEALERKHG